MVKMDNVDNKLIFVFDCTSYVLFCLHMHELVVHVRETKQGACDSSIFRISSFCFTAIDLHPFLFGIIQYMYASVEPNVRLDCFYQDDKLVRVHSWGKKDIYLPVTSL